MKIPLLWLTAVLMMPAPLEAQDPKSQSSSPPLRPEAPVRPPASQIRISSNVYVGEAAPGFELTNATGARVKLSRFRGDRVLLAFADRREAFSPFAAVAESLRAEGVHLVGVCHASPRSLKMIADRNGLGFQLLSDQTGQVSAIYGAFDFASSATLPAYVLVGRQGTVRMVLVGQTLPPADLLQLTRLALTGLP
jgi:peroxiredoxin